MLNILTVFLTGVVVGQWRHPVNVLSMTFTVAVKQDALVVNEMELSKFSFS